MEHLDVNNRLDWRSVCDLTLFMRVAAPSTHLLSLILVLPLRIYQGT